MVINYGLSGFGGIAKTHLMGLNNLDFLNVASDLDVNFKGLTTTSLKEKKSLAERVGFEKVVDNFDDLLAIEDLDLVDLCTPNFIHKQEIIKSIKAEKNIYCEKPIALNLAEAEEILTELEGSSIKHQMAFVYRFLPAVAYAHALLNNKVIGDVQFAKVEVYHSRYLNPKVDMTWRLREKSSGGGALVDLGSHMIDLIRFLLGDVSSVTAWTNTFIPERRNRAGVLEEVDVDDWSLLMMDLASGANASMEASRVSPGDEGFRVEIFGNKGAIHINSKEINKPKLFDQRPKEVEITDDLIQGDRFLDKLLNLYPSSKLSQGVMIDLHLVSLLWFLESICGKDLPAGASNFRDGYQVQKVIEYAYYSARENNSKIMID